MKRLSIHRSSLAPANRFAAACSIVLGLLLSSGAAAQAVQVDELAQCRALSQLPDEVHNCLDNFLDSLDVDMQALELEVVDQLGGQFSPLAMAFSDAQTAYKAYRASNCLWYQSFSSPIDLAEQIAKACLIGMSHARLKEINDLLQVNTVEGPNAVALAESPASEGSGRVSVAGYYLYGVDRNSLQLCGTAARYWVEGDTEEIADLQRAYTEKAADDNPLLFVEVTGIPNTDIDARNYPGHEGVFSLDTLMLAQASFDGDCAQSRVAAAMTGIAPAPVERSAEVEPGKLESPAATQATPPEVVPISQQESQQGSQQAAAAPQTTLAAEAPAPAPENPVLNAPPLVAYFGDWTVACSYLGSSFGCALSTSMQGNSMPEILQPVLKLVRRTNKRTIVDLAFPGQEITSIGKIRWTIDSNVLGVLTESRLRVGDTAVIQELRQRSYIQRQLLPAMLAGYNLVVTVIDETEGPVPYKGTLVGLTRALTFADRYTASGGNI